MSKLSFDILAIARCHSQYRAEQMAPYGLKACHISYLINICRYPGISQDKLAQKIYFNKSNVARQAAVLEEAGYITRQSAPADKRVMELYPTEKAIALIPEIRKILDRWNDMVTQDLTPEEIETVSHLLDKMKDKAALWMNEH